MKNRATNSAGMKKYNRYLIINVIRKKPVSRAELARITGLTRAAVTLIVDDLLKDGVIIETGTGDADYGRKPVLLDLNPNGYFAIGISITRNGCTIGIMNIKGVLLDKRQIDLDQSSDAHMDVQTIAESVQTMVRESNYARDRILGIGISTPGPVDINAGVILNPPNFNKWHNINIVKEFKTHFNDDILLENNAVSLAIAEKNYGSGKEYQSFMLMVVDTGIGAGIIINDAVYRGVSGFGSEMGHTSIDFNGKECNCGNRGCMEVYASMPAVTDEIQGYNKGITKWSEIVDRASDGDDLCRQAIEKEALYLSSGIVNAMNILELEAVILTGDIQYKPDLLLEQLRKNVERTAITRHIRKVHIMMSSIKGDMEIISSASTVFEKFYKGELHIVN